MALGHVGMVTLDPVSKAKPHSFSPR